MARKLKQEQKRQRKLDKAKGEVEENPETDQENSENQHVAAEDTVSPATMQNIE